jgi:hydrogenase maturation protease
MRQPGHRFFFGPSEVEPLPKTESEPQRAKQKQRILIAGIGNIFLGDDAFGVEAIKRLAMRKLPETVRVTDFGIRGFDLMYALQDGYETTILVDASPQGQPPGTVFVMEPDLNSAGSSEQQSVVETHGMNPMNVIRMAKAMNVPLKRLLVVGCEPETLGGAEGHMGLSVTVQAALDEAVNVIENVVNRILDGTWQDTKS